MGVLLSAAMEDFHAIGPLIPPLVVGGVTKNIGVEGAVIGGEIVCCNSKRK